MAFVKSVDFWLVGNILFIFARASLLDFFPHLKHRLGRILFFLECSSAFNLLNLFYLIVPLAAFSTEPLCDRGFSLRAVMRAYENGGGDEADEAAQS